MIWELLFWLSVLGLFHSYVFYPLLLSLLAKGKQLHGPQFSTEELPPVSIVLAAYNEEAVIEEKIRSTFRTSYPGGVEMLIGSDASTDRTDEIIQQYEKEHAGLRLVRFPGRTGKAGIINQLVEQAQHEILVLTDANILFEEDTLRQLVRHFADPQIAMVGGNIVNQTYNRQGISFQEKTYQQTENVVKYREGVLWGTMIGAFGGLYAIRKKYYHPVPPRFFMDDFYISMHALEDGGKAILEPEAVCYEDVSNKISEEFRRKVRISIGNFQNLKRFRQLLWPPWSGLGFSFLSHKVLRWLGPFFILVALLSNLFLLDRLFYQFTLVAQLLLLAMPIAERLLKHLGVHLKIVRFITHFYVMNLALLTGFFRFIYGVKTNIWRPTQRHQ